MLHAAKLAAEADKVVKRWTWRNKVIFALYAIVPPFLFIFILAVVLPQLHRLVAFTISRWNPENQITIGAIGVSATAVIGWALYEFKKRSQMFYGIVEVIASFASCFYTFQKILAIQPEPLDIVIPIVTAIYFTQRGLTNFFDGKTIRDKKRIGKQKLSEKLAVEI